MTSSSSLSWRHCRSACATFDKPYAHRASCRQRQCLRQGGWFTARHIMFL